LPLASGAFMIARSAHRKVPPELQRELGDAGFEVVAADFYPYTGRFSRASAGRPGNHRRRRAQDLTTDKGAPDAG
jgi:hypothetical protein